MRAVDVMGFAGGFDCGVTQAGFDVVAKREPSEFDGFGVPSVELNLGVVDVEVTEAEIWSVRKADMVFGNPPCSGFSALSAVNKAGFGSRTVDQRGIDAPDNRWLPRFVSYAAKVKPEVAVFECVQAGGKLGAPLMRRLWQQMRDESGLDYRMTDVFMNAALVGGNVIRPRYFWVAHLRPFGVDLPREVPLTMRDVVGDLPEAEDRDDLDWGHMTTGGKTTDRIARTIVDLRAEGLDWAPGTRLKTNFDELVSQGGAIPEYWYHADGRVMSHAVKDHLYVPVRARPDVPFGVIVGDAMARVVHPWAARTITYREAARLMGLPDAWSLRPIVERRAGQWIGKGIPVASGRWIASWARASIEGDPGEYAGVELEPGHRVVDVTTKAKVDEVDRDVAAPVWWDRGERPNRGVFVPAWSLDPTPDNAAAVVGGAIVPTGPVKVARRPPRTDRDRHARPPGPGARPIVRVRPETVRALIEEVGLTRASAATALGVSASRIGELTTDSRPGSWLNASRLDAVERSLRAYASAHRP